MNRHLRLFGIPLVVAGIGIAVAQQQQEQQNGTEAKAEAIFQKADKNSDGKVTPEELPNAETFANFDLNQDGQITREEGMKVLMRMAASAAAAAPTESSSPERIFDYLDKNKDGGLTDDELPQQARRLKALDQDKDGRITRAEAIEGLKRFQSKLGITPSPDGAPAQPVVIGPDVIKGGDIGVGRQLPDLAFTTLDGKKLRLSELAAAKGTVIAFTSITCPVSQRYSPALARLGEELTARGIALLLVNPFASEKVDEIKADLAHHKITAPYVHDSNKALATALRARTTTEVFLVDATRTLLYRGAIDDQYGLNYNLDAPRQRYLADAVQAMLLGALPHVAATEAPGCELDLSAENSVAATNVTYHRDVARILQQNCVQCHREGGIAPFALDDLAEVQDRAKTIKRVVEQGQMPPWFAAPAKDGSESPWANDCSLGARDRADLLAWLDSKERSLGDVKDAPAKLQFASEWNIGKPDLIVQIPKPIAVKAEGYMPYQFAVAQTTLTEDKWVTAYEVLPTQRAVVHHVIVQVHEKGTDVRDRDEGNGGFFAAYVPGNGSRVYPEGFARKLPAGARVSFQIHYTPNGKAVQEQVRMGLVFAKETPKYEVKTLALADHKLAIPPGAANHEEWIEKPVPFDLHALAFVPHMHVRGKAFRYEATMPDGRQEVLLDIPRYDFNWQIRYEYKQPLLLPRGSKVKVTATYDNSPGNKANPDPTKLVKWGQQTYDEMMIGYIEFFVPISSTVAAR
jgi:Ca2+-binding EF-hand superfamily protein/mono/diheme cytochrome c family protein